MSFHHRVIVHSANCSRYTREWASSHRSFLFFLFFFSADLAETPSFKKLAGAVKRASVAPLPFADIPRPLSSPVPKKSVSTKLAAVIAKPIYHNRTRHARVLFQIHYTRVYNTWTSVACIRARVLSYYTRTDRERKREKEKERYGKRQKRGRPLSLIFNDWLAGLAIWPITVEFLEFRGITNQNYMVGAAPKVSARIGNKISDPRNRGNIYHGTNRRRYVT